MTDRAKAVPEGFHTLTPTLVVRGAARAIEFYKEVFGAQEVMRMTTPDGQAISHAEIKIGDSPLMLSDEFPEYGARAPEGTGADSFGLFLYVEDVDKVFERAVAAGATVKMPVADQFWGDRYGKVVDPFGHQWGIATHVEDLSAEEIESRAAALFGKADAAQS
jgi:PhnB protein